MGLLLFLVFGFFVGLIARGLLPGRQSMGIALTTLLGVAGSFLGGLIGNLVAGYAVTAPHPAGLIGSVIGAILLLVLATRGRHAAA